MRLLTHVVFAACVAAATAIRLGCSPSCALYAAVAAALVNISLDVLGHEVRAGIPRRTAFSHSLVGPLFFAMPFIYPALELGSTATILAVAVGAYSHLLLDAVTEGGVYLAWPLKKKRYRIARIPYNDRIANNAAMMLGAAILAWSII